MITTVENCLLTIGTGCAIVQALRRTVRSRKGAGKMSTSEELDQVDRIDWVSMRVPHNNNEAHAVIQDVIRTLDKAHVGRPKPYKYWSRLNDKGGEETFLEVWGGEADRLWAESVLHLYTRYVTRMDFRLDLPWLTASHVLVATIVAPMLSTGTPSLNTYRSRPRKKQEGRHGGGDGVAWGSHGSDRRLSLYKRTDEESAIELQLRGKMLQGFLNHYHSNREELMPMGLSHHQHLLADAYHALKVHTRAMANLSLYHLFGGHLMYRECPSFIAILKLPVVGFAWEIDNNLGLFDPLDGAVEDWMRKELKEQQLKAAKGMQWAKRQVLKRIDGKNMMDLSDDARELYRSYLAHVSRLVESQNEDSA